jgi:hypothetical protein
MINVEPSITLLSDILNNSAIIGRGFMAESKIANLRKTLAELVKAWTTTFKSPSVSPWKRNSVGLLRSSAKPPNS